MSQPPIRLALFGLVNTYLVPEEDGLTLIDTGMPPLVPRIVKTAARLGKPVRRVLLTHGHTDHAGGLDAVRNAFPHAEVMMHGADLHHLEEGGVATRPDHLLRGGERIGSLRVIPAPGHSAGQVAFLDGRDGTLYAGDSFTTLGKIRAVSEFQLGFGTLPWLASEDRAQATRSAALLADLPGVRWLAPGHGTPQAGPTPLMREAVLRAQQDWPVPPWQLAFIRPLQRAMAARPRRD